MREQNVNTWGKEHGLTPATVKRMKLRRVTQAEVTKLLGFPAPAGGVLIPYFDVNGKLTDFFRVRFDNYAFSFAKQLGLKPMRYAQARGSGVYIYFPSLKDWSKIGDEDQLLISEGEAKSVKACQEGFFCIGLGGVGMWRSTTRLRQLHSDLAQIAKGRQVSIAFDSDAATNPNVRAEECALASALVDAGAHVKIVRLPSGNETKVGLDDFLIARDADELQTLIEETKEYSLSRDMHELSAQYVYVRALSRVAELGTGDLFDPRTFVDALEAPRHTIVDGANGKPRLVSAARAWLESSTRPEVKRLTYRPGSGRITEDRELNEWEPSNIEPHEGDTAPFDELLMHLVPAAQENDWLENWFAAPLQQPGLKLATAVVLWGSYEGTGKTLLGSTIGLLHGKRNFIEVGQAEIASPYNDWQAGKTFIMGSELCGERESRAFADKLKTIVTGDTIAVHRKYQPLYTLPNCANYFLTSNHENAVYIGDHARRFGVFNVEASPLPSKFYERFCRWRDNGGTPALLYRLLTKDLSNFNPKGHALKTAAREEMVAANRTQVQQWAYELKENPDTLLSIGNVTVPDALFTTKQLLQFFNFGQQTRLTDKGMALALYQAGFRQALKGALIRIPHSTLRLRLWVIRDSSRIERMSAGEVGAEYGRKIRTLKVVRRAAK